MGALLACGCDGESGQRFDARKPIDAAPPPPGDARLGVDCVGELCEPDQTCCRVMPEPPQHFHFCAPVADACDGVAYDCDGPEDCESETCCSLGEAWVRCVDAGACDGYVACHVDADCAPFGRCCDTPAGVIRVCLAACAK